jgi:DNA adenine methylase
MPAYPSPLRYPGGKGRLSNYVKLIIKKNELIGCDYTEPYAGGSGIALDLLFKEFVDQIHINDLSLPIYSFWHSVLNEAQSLSRLILDTDVTIDEWNKQKKILSNEKSDLLKLGFATFFLNRTNRSGILKGGVIGGKKQSGKYKIDARFNKENLIKRIKKIARFKERINVYNKDAEVFIKEINKREFHSGNFFYLDPPYYVTGKGLYDNFYEYDDHESVSNSVDQITYPWIVSYDYHHETQKLYGDYRSLVYKLSYSAQNKYKGSEIIFFSPLLDIPSVESPLKIPSDAFG